MKTIGNLARKLEKASNVIPFHRTSRSGGGETFNGKDWLSALKLNTEFLARAYAFDGSSLIQYKIIRISKKARYMVTSTNELIIVDPERFCRVTELVEILDVSEQRDPV